MNFTTVDVDRNLEAALAAFRRLPRVTWQVSLGGALARGDARALGHVWANLLNNAVQAMDYQGTLKVVTRAEGNQALVQIDFGPGIPLEIQGKLFDPSYSKRNDGDGIGLGLDLCLKIVTRHQGTLDVESRPGYTCFSVRLPAA